MPLNHACELLEESVFSTIETNLVNYVQYRQDGTSRTLKILYYLRPRKTVIDLSIRTFY
jgi:hypothetical protein